MFDTTPDAEEAVSVRSVAILLIVFDTAPDAEEAVFDTSLAVSPKLGITPELELELELEFVVYSSFVSIFVVVPLSALVEFPESNFDIEFVIFPKNELFSDFFAFSSSSSSSST